MDVKLDRRELRSFRMICNEEKTAEAVAETVVPDTQDDISRILSSEHSCCIKSKDIGSGRIAVRGEVHTTVLYLPESGGICHLELTAPFNAEFMCSEADSGSFALSEISIIAADTRLNNPRKVSVRAELTVSVICYKDMSTELFAVPEEVCGTVFFKNESAKISSVVLATEKTFTVNDEHSLPSAATEYELLHGSAKCLFDSSERVGSRLIVRGHLEISACIKDAEENLYCPEFSSPFSQLFELSDGEGELYSDVTMLLTGEYFEIMGGQLCADVHVLAQLVCSEEQEIEYICDAYACRGAYGTKREETVFSRIESDSCAGESFSLRYDSGAPVSKVLHSSARADRAAVRDGRVSVPISVDLLFQRADGTLDSCRVRESLTSENLTPTGGERITAAVTGLSAVPAGDSIDIKAELKICRKCDVHEIINAVCAMSVEDCEKCDRASVYITKAESADLWSLAKKYGSSEKAIITANAVETADEAVGKMILIPVI